MSSKDQPVGVQVSPALSIVDARDGDEWTREPEPAFDEVSRVQPVVEPAPPPYGRVRWLEPNCKRLLSVGVPPKASYKIDSLADAIAYHHHRLAGDWIVRTRTNLAILVRVDPDETHPYSDKQRPDGNAIEVRRANHKNELRYFDAERARMMDEIFPTLANHKTVIRARDLDGVQIVGHPGRGGRRFSVILDLDELPCEDQKGKLTLIRYRLRTGYPLRHQVAEQLLRAKPVLWPPR